MPNLFYFELILAELSVLCVTAIFVRTCNVLWLEVVCKDLMKCFCQVTLEDELEAEKRLSESLMKTVDELRAAQKAWLCKEAKLETEVQQVTSELNSTKAKVSSL